VSEKCAPLSQLFIETANVDFVSLLDPDFNRLHLPTYNRLSRVNAIRS
jgi:hypothetical protein